MKNENFEQNYNQSNETKIEIFSDHAVRVERPDATFRIIYEEHDKPNKTENFKNLDAFAIEVVNPSSAAPEVYLNDLIVRKLSEPDQNLEEFFRKEIKPVYFIDLNEFKYGEFSDLLSRRNLLQRAEQLLGGVFGIKAAIDVVRGLSSSDKKISRRNFLKASADAALGAYFGLPLLKGILDSVEGKAPAVEGSFYRSVDRGVIGIEDAIHPELDGVVRVLRNEVWAHKLDQIAKAGAQKLNRRPEIGVLVGRNHSDLENVLEEDQDERLATIRRCFKLFGLKDEYELSRVSVCKYSSEEKKWIINSFQDSLLKQIENEV